MAKETKSREEIEFEQWSDEKFCLEAVKRHGDSLSFVKEQTEAICLEAVKRNGYSLSFVKEQKLFISILKKRKVPKSSPTT